ncbi:5'/3'-nucleotidase SurE [Paractinoplanes hotanensis]|uniref:5'-nucleotidase n=1 Tax=Paractinoplanes hotanensis TaxID=2906497 RepID=A0ABT0Y265_9ACTN|nr:5'/3'-nucleotidase SurE [Actinoplanes hotanensis]MCM4079592.1 5'/3'-nucleotidase SurE [Actinoplanes hotanensis]
MRVLITNDDGVSAPGILALAAAVTGSHDVVVAAPQDEASGMSAALTAVVSDGQIVVAPFELPGITAYGVAASPAYIVVLASLGVFGPPPDIVLSGINRGANAGRAVLHSGTVGAALTAANYGMRAMAVSLDVLNADATVSSASGSSASGGNALVVPSDDVLHWPTAASIAASLMDAVATVPAGTVLNVNVPDRAREPELREATLASFGQAGIAVAEAGEGYVRTTIERTGESLVPGTDLALLAEGYATVTALRPPVAVAGVQIPAQRRP